MVLRAGSVIFLAVLCTVLNVTIAKDPASHIGESSEDDDTDDEKPLREALLLIKLIRRADLSRETRQLSKHGAIPAPLSPDPPQALPNVTYNNNSRASRSNYRRSLTDGANTSTEDSTTIAPTDDITVAMPGNAANTVEVASKAPATAAPIAAWTGNNTQNKALKLYGNIARSKIPDRGRKKTTQSNDTKNKKIQIKPKNDPPNIKIKTNDPGAAQVESELKSEMETVKDKVQAIKSWYKFTKTFEASSRTKPHSTLRVYLEGSTRYPIPFPENHALCYTDPKNALCRTPI